MDEMKRAVQVRLDGAVAEVYRPDYPIPAWEHAEGGFYQIAGVNILYSACNGEGRALATSDAEPDEALVLYTPVGGAMPADCSEYVCFVRSWSSWQARFRQRTELPPGAYTATVGGDQVVIARSSDGVIVVVWSDGRAQSYSKAAFFVEGLGFWSGSVRDPRFFAAGLKRISPRAE